MGLRIKDNVELEELRKYGFKLGKDYAEAGERCMGEGNEYQYEWYHKYLLREDDGRIRYAYHEYEIPTVEILVRPEDRIIDLYCTPEEGYYISTPEMDVVLETIFELAKDGLLEKEL